MDQDDWAEAEQPRRSFGPRTIEIGDVLSSGWTAGTRFYWLCLGVLLVYFLLTLPGQLPLIGFFYGILLGGPLYGGLSYFSIQVVRGKPRFDNFFAGFRRFGTMLGIYLLQALIMTPALVPLMLGAYYAETDGTGIGLILLGFALTLALSLVMVRFWFAFGLAVVEDLGAIDAMRRSWDGTRGNWLPLIGLSILMGLILIVLTLLLILPLYFVGGPLSIGVAGIAYERLFGGDRETVDVFS